MATLNGIDVSSYQRGIDLAKLPVDFVIVKATEGTGYTNPDCARAVEQALAAGKIVGVYHYVNGVGSTAEADFFVSQCKGWIGKVIFAIDWESGGNKAWGNTGYLDAVIKRVKVGTGKPPLVYASSSAFPWAVAKANDCGTWVAQYASKAATGFQTSPWHSRDWSGACLIRQYTDNLRISGWNGGLDGNVAFCDRATLAKYISGKSAASSKPAASKPAASKPAASPSKSSASKPAASSTLDVRAIQRAVHVTADNVVGKATRTAVSLVAQASNWGGGKFPNGVAATQRAVGANPDGVWGPASKAAHDATVAAIQTALVALGYKIAVDKIWGNATEAAVTDALNRGKQA